uniref:Leptin receptor n=1 Tax=Myotis myotis TaxID=51298 RepID=A0A7J7ZXM9_MYOMY|nr:leptin receptor [Myotis myotis]
MEKKYSGRCMRYMMQNQNLSVSRCQTCVQSTLLRCAVRGWMDWDIGVIGVLQPTQWSWM